MVICLERGANDLHMVQLKPLPPHRLCFIKIQNGFTFLVLSYPGCPGKKAAKLVSVCYEHRCNKRLQTFFILKNNELSSS